MKILIKKMEISVTYKKDFLKLLMLSFTKIDNEIKMIRR